MKKTWKTIYPEHFTQKYVDAIEKVTGTIGSKDHKSLMTNIYGKNRWLSLPTELFEAEVKHIRKRIIGEYKDGTMFAFKNAHGIRKYVFVTAEELADKNNWKPGKRKDTLYFSTPKIVKAMFSRA